MQEFTTEDPVVASCILQSLYGISLPWEIHKFCHITAWYPGSELLVFQINTIWCIANIPGLFSWPDCGSIMIGAGRMGNHLSATERNSEKNRRLARNASVGIHAACTVALAIAVGCPFWFYQEGVTFGLWQDCIKSTCYNLGNDVEGKISMTCIYFASAILWN